jgi:hypothetical protein
VQSDDSAAVVFVVNEVAVFLVCEQELSVVPNPV